MTPAQPRHTAGAPIESVGSLLSRVSEAHYTRMAALGLSA